MSLGHFTSPPIIATPLNCYHPPSILNWRVCLCVYYLQCDSFSDDLSFHAVPYYQISYCFIYHIISNRIIYFIFYRRLNVRQPKADVIYHIIYHIISNHIIYIICYSRLNFRQPKADVNLPIKCLIITIKIKTL